MAALQVALFFGIFTAFTSAALNPIREHPRSVAVHKGQWANFSCGIKLPGTIRWRIGDFSANGYVYNAAGYLHGLTGVTTERSFAPDITGKVLTETIGVLATAALDGVPVECMYGHPALASRNSYSKFALLEVRNSCVPKMLSVEVTLKKIRAAFKLTCSQPTNISYSLTFTGPGMRWETDSYKLTQQQPTDDSVKTVELRELQRFTLNTNYSMIVTVTTDSGSFTSENFMFDTNTVLHGA